MIQLGLFHTLSLPSPSFATLCQTLGVSGEIHFADRFGAALRFWRKTSLTKSIRTLSLFSGAGGLDIAFHDAGFSVLQAVELEPRFCATLNHNARAGGYLEGTQVLCMDIREYDPPSDTKIDFIIGGPPCQSFSSAGRRAAGVAGMQDDRGILFREYIRLLRMLKPVGFLFENVYGITGAEGGKAWEQILREFEATGYTISSRVLDAADFGVPQHRERMFIVGLREGRFQFPRPTHGPDSPDARNTVSASEALVGSVITEREQKATLGGKYGHLLKDIPPGLNYSFFTEEMGHPMPIFAWRSKFSDFLYKADPKTPIRTLKAQGGQYTGPFHWENRPFGVSELKRLQTIPDAYHLVGGRQALVHQIGNSVPPQLARILALQILSQAFGVALPCILPTLEEGEPLGFRSRKRELTNAYRLKAEAAICGSRTSANFTPLAESSTRSYLATIGEGFSWSIHTAERNPQCTSPYEKQIEEDEDCRFSAQESVPKTAQVESLWIQYDANCSQWLFEVGSIGKKRTRNPAFKIVVFGHTARPWSLGRTCVELRGNAATREVFLGLWKAFEFEIIQQRLKADLIQLAGYYQYPPRFHCQMFSEEIQDARWSVLAKVVAGVGTREIFKEEQLAELWKVQPSDILQLVLWLRSFGYEARNHRTNLQIPPQSYLLPYAFPTLTPQSVQLRKKMENQDETTQSVE